MIYLTPNGSIISQEYLRCESTQDLLDMADSYYQKAAFFYKLAYAELKNNTNCIKRGQGREAQNPLNK